MSEKVDRMLRKMGRADKVSKRMWKALTVNQKTLVRSEYKADVLANSVYGNVRVESRVDQLQKLFGL